MLLFNLTSLVLLEHFTRGGGELPSNDHDHNTRSSSLFSSSTPAASAGKWQSRGFNCAQCFAFRSDQMALHGFHSRGLLALEKMPREFIAFACLVICQAFYSGAHRCPSLEFGFLLTVDKLQRKGTACTVYCATRNLVVGEYQEKCWSKGKTNDSSSLQNVCGMHGCM